MKEFINSLENVGASPICVGFMAAAQAAVEE